MNTPVKYTKSTALSNKQRCNRWGAPPTRHRAGWGGSQSTRCEALTHLLNILRVLFAFYLSCVLVKTEREVLLELTPPSEGYNHAHA